MEKVLFKETQKFSRNWMVLILIVPVLIFVYAFISQVIMGSPFGSNPMPNWAIILVLIFLLCMTWIVLNLKLTTKINLNEIIIHYPPFAEKSFKRDDLENYEVIDYGFVGGWGLRMFTKYGTVYNVKGSKGLALILKNGDKYVIGTQKEQELEEAISKF